MPSTPASNGIVDLGDLTAAGPNSGTAERPPAREIQGGSALTHPFVTPFKSHLPSHLFHQSSAKYSGGSTPGAASSYGIDSPLFSSDEASTDDDGDESLGIRARREESLGGLSFAHTSDNSRSSTGAERSVDVSSPANSNREDTPSKGNEKTSLEEGGNVLLMQDNDQGTGGSSTDASCTAKLSSYEEIARPPPLKLVETKDTRLDIIEEVSEESSNLGKSAVSISAVDSSDSGGTLLTKGNASPAGYASRSPTDNSDNVRFAFPRQAAIQTTLSPLAAKFTSTAAPLLSGYNNDLSPSKKSYRRTPFPSPGSNSPDTPRSGYDGSSLLSYYMQSSPTRTRGGSTSTDIACDVDDDQAAVAAGSQSYVTSTAFDSPSPVLSRDFSGERAHRSFPELRTTMMSTPKMSRFDVFANKSDPMVAKSPRFPADSAAISSRYAEEMHSNSMSSTSEVNAGIRLRGIASSPVRFPQGVQHGEKFDFTISSTDSDQEDDTPPSPALSERSFDFSELDIHNTPLESLLAREKIRDILWHSRDTYRADDEDILPPDSASLGPVSPSFGHFPEHAFAPWHHLRDGAASPSSVVTERPLSRYETTSSLYNGQIPHGVSDARPSAKQEQVKSKVRKIPSLVGPNALPYARCPSGIDSYAYDFEDPSPHEPIKDVGPVHYHGGFKFSITPKAAAVVAARSSRTSSPLPSPTTQQPQDSFGKSKAAHQRSSFISESDDIAKSRMGEVSIQDSRLQAYGVKDASGRPSEVVSIGRVYKERDGQDDRRTSGQQALPTQAIANMVSTFVGSDHDASNYGHMASGSPALGQSVMQDWMYDPAKQGWIRRDKALPIKPPPSASAISPVRLTPAHQHCHESTQQAGTFPQAPETAVKHKKTPSIAIIDATPPRGMRQERPTLLTFSPQQQLPDSPQPRHALPDALLPFLPPMQKNILLHEDASSQVTPDRARAWAYGSQMAVATGVDASADRQSQSQLTLHTRRVLEMLRYRMNQPVPAASAATLPVANSTAYPTSAFHAFPAYLESADYTSASIGQTPLMSTVPSMNLAGANPSAVDSALASIAETNAKLRLLLHQTEHNYLQQIEQLASQSVGVQPSLENQTVYTQEQLNGVVDKDVQSEESRLSDEEKPAVYQHPNSKARRYIPSLAFGRPSTPAFGIIGTRPEPRLEAHSTSTAMSAGEVFVQSMRIGYPTGVVATQSRRDISPDRGTRGVEEDPAIVRSIRRLSLSAVQPSPNVQLAPSPSLTMAISAVHESTDPKVAGGLTSQRHSLPPRPATQPIAQNILGAVWSDPKDALSKKKVGGKRDSRKALESSALALKRIHVRQDSVGHERRRRERSNAPSPEERTKNAAAKQSSLASAPATNKPAFVISAQPLRASVLGQLTSNISRKDSSDIKKAQLAKIDTKGKTTASYPSRGRQGSAQFGADKMVSKSKFGGRADVSAKGMVGDGDVKWKEFVNAMGGVPASVGAGSVKEAHK